MRIHMSLALVFAMAIAAAPLLTVVLSQSEFGPAPPQSRDVDSNIPTSKVVSVDRRDHRLVSLQVDGDVIRHKTSKPAVLDELDSCRLEGFKSKTKNAVPVFRRALTWKKIRHDAVLGIDLVGCSGGNPYRGDTDINKKLPILAIRVRDLPRPNYDVDGRGHAMTKEYYRGWTGGEIALTPPILGSDLTSREVADELCRKYCGKGFRMADFHDGKYVKGMDYDHFFGQKWPGAARRQTGGWYFWAFGDIPDNSRFWVAIGDQNSNCWNR